MKKAYQAYYGLLILGVLSMVIYTLYQGSLVLAYGKQQQKLRTQQVSLLEQQQQLQIKLAAENSLIRHSQTEDTEGFELINHPIIVSAQNNLAAAE